MRRRRGERGSQENIQKVNGKGAETDLEAGRAKVDEFDGGLVGVLQQHVLGLQIAVDDSLFTQKT
jgi:hypothetical protein